MASQPKVAYADALATLSAMFPALQPDVIAMVLELNVRRPRRKSPAPPFRARRSRRVRTR